MKSAKGIVTSVHSAKAGHPGGSLSAADLFTYLYFEELNVDPKRPEKKRTEIVSSSQRDIQRRGFMPRWQRKDFSRKKI